MLGPAKVSASIAIVTASAIVFAACGSDDSNAASGGADGGSNDATSGADASADGAASDGSVIVGDATVPPPPPPTCDAPIKAADVSTPTTVVGNGAGTCTEQALVAAVAKGGVVTFDCGASPATIAISAQIELPKKDLVIDGGGKVTLDGRGKTRLFNFDGGNFRVTRTTFTFQHITLTAENRRAPRFLRRLRRARKASRSTEAAPRSSCATASCTSSTSRS